MTLDEINRLRALKAKDDGIAFDLEILKVADQLLDAAARADRAEAEREETRKAWCVLRSALNAIAWGKWDNDAFPRRVAQDSLAIGCPVANARAEKSAMEALEAANALLRAECVASRVLIVPITEPQMVVPEHMLRKIDLDLQLARAATDAAGMLKGGE